MASNMDPDWMLLMILRRKNLGVLHPALNPGDTGLTSATAQTTIWIRGTNCSFAGDAKRTIRDKSTYAISDAPCYYSAFIHTTIFLQTPNYCNLFNEWGTKVYLIYCHIGEN